jgi:hypothetical protein
LVKKTKVVELKVLNNFYFGNFSSFNTNLKVISQFPKKIKFWGGELQYPGGFLLCLAVAPPPCSILLHLRGDSRAWMRDQAREAAPEATASSLSF